MRNLSIINFHILHIINSPYLTSVYDSVNIVKAKSVRSISAFYYGNRGIRLNIKNSRFLNYLAPYISVERSSLDNCDIFTGTDINIENTVFDGGCSTTDAAFDITAATSSITIKECMFSNIYMSSNGFVMRVTPSVDLNIIGTCFSTITSPVLIYAPIVNLTNTAIDGYSDQNYGYILFGSGSLTASELYTNISNRNINRITKIYCSGSNTEYDLQFSYGISCVFSGNAFKLGSPASAIMNRFIFVDSSFGSDIISVNVQGTFTTNNCLIVSCSSLVSSVSVFSQGSTASGANNFVVASTGITVSGVWTLIERTTSYSTFTLEQNTYLLSCNIYTSPTEVVTQTDINTPPPSSSPSIDSSISAGTGVGAAGAIGVVGFVGSSLVAYLFLRRKFIHTNIAY